jgi:hypothetical protein
VPEVGGNGDLEVFKIVEGSGKREGERSRGRVREGEGGGGQTLKELYIGDLDQLTEIIARFSTKPSFLVYSESEKGVQRHLIEPHTNFFRELYGINRSLTFSQSSIKGVLAKVAATNGNSCWPRELTKEEVSDFSERVARRLRLMCRHLSQSHRKKVAWALKLLGDEGPAEGELQPAFEMEGPALIEVGDDSARSKSNSGGAMKRPSAATDETPDSGYFYGFDFEMFKAWREPASGGKRDYAEVTVPDEAEKTDFPVAQFDGVDTEIRAITCGEIRDKRVVVLKGRGSYWEGATADGKRLRVAR